MSSEITRKRQSKIEKYKLTSKILNMLADNRTYVQIADELVDFVRNKRKNNDLTFYINPNTIRNWWIENYQEYGGIVEQKRAAIVQKRAQEFIDKGWDLRDKIIDELEEDAKCASAVAKTSTDFESTARIREKQIRAQESGEKRVAKVQPNINLTQFNVNPIYDFKEKMKEASEKKKKEEKKVIDIDFEEIDDEEKDKGNTTDGDSD